MLRLGLVASSTTPTPTPSGGAILTMVGASPYLHAWQFTSATGFGTKFADPASIPPITSSGGLYITYGAPSIAVSPSSKAFILGVPNPPYLYACPFSSLGFGTPYSAPSPLPPVSYGALTGPGFVTFSPDGQAVACCVDQSGATTVTFPIYAWNDISGFGAKYTDPSFSPGELRQYGNSQVRFSPDGQSIAFGLLNSPYVAVFRWSSSTGVGARYSNPAVVPTAEANTIWDNTSTVLWIGTSAWEWNSTTGFGAVKFLNQLPVINSDQSSINSFSPDGQTVLLNAVFTFRVAAYNSATGVGSLYSLPAYFNVTNVLRAYAPDNASIAVGMSYAASNVVQVGAWNNATGFGAQYADPAQPITGIGQALSLAFLSF